MVVYYKVDCVYLGVVNLVIDDLICVWWVDIILDEWFIFV